MRSPALCIACCGLSVGCVVDLDAPDAATAGGKADEPGRGADVDWVSCAAVPGGEPSGAECASIEAPLSHADPTLGTIALAVKRIRSSEPTTRQLWLVDGGPGASAVDDVVAIARGLSAEAGRHRGPRRRDPRRHLGRDLGALMEQFRVPGARLFVYGGSYGT